MKSNIYLRDRSIFILNYLKKKNPSSIVIDEFISLVSNLYLNKASKELKIISRDISEMGKSLSREDSKELQGLLKLYFNDSLDGDKFHLKIIEDVLISGKIKNLEEYEVVLQVLNNIDDSYYLEEKKQRLEDILLEWHRRDGNISNGYLSN